MSIFGWDLPPGCTSQHIDDAYGSEGPCACCGRDPSKCICPECPSCSDVGNPSCYKVGHPDGQRLEYSTAQLIGQTKQRISDLEMRLSEERWALELLEQRDAPIQQRALDRYQDWATD